MVAFSEAKWYLDTPSEIADLSHITCLPKRGNSNSSIRAGDTRFIGRVLLLCYCVIFRILLFTVSATYTLPAESTATPYG